MISTYDNVKFGDSRPLTDLLDQLASERKHDEIRSYSGLKVDDNCKLLDGGASFTKRGFASLCRLTSMPPVMVDWLSRHDYQSEVARFINFELLGCELNDEQNNRPRKRVFARFRGDKEGNQLCRALFSDRYAAVDAKELVAMVADSLTAPEREQARVQRLSYDGDELLCNLIWPGCDREVGGDAYQVGLAIQTSEIGTLRMLIQPWLGRLRCENGLVVNSPIGQAVSKRHVGRIDMNELAASIREVVGSALAHADRALMQLDECRTIEVSDADRIIVQLGRELRLTNDQIKGWLRGHESTLTEPTVQNQSAFSILNGLTASARMTELESSERVHLESLGGRILAPKLESSMQEVEAHWRNVEVRAKMLSDEVFAEYRK